MCNVFQELTVAPPPGGNSDVRAVASRARPDLQHNEGPEEPHDEGARAPQDVQEVRCLLTVSCLRQGLWIPAQSLGSLGVPGGQLPPPDGERGAP